MKNICIFASGNGSNAENVVKFFTNSDVAKVNLIISNNPQAYVLKRAENLNVPHLVINKNHLNNAELTLKILKEDYNIDFIVLAGFLLLIPNYLIDNFPNRIVNIHPALLPKYGGKGMYGDNVHKAVLENKELFSGITIHYVNEHYDEGQIIFQAKCEISPNETVNSLAQKVHQLEYEYYPKIISSLIQKIEQ